MPCPAILDPNNLSFPDINTALSDPNGLLAIGGDLSLKRLLYAYEHGIFPWYSKDEPIMWWSPDPRTVLFLKDLHISKSLAKTLKNHPYRITLDKSFKDVVNQCALVRKGAGGTWITTDMQQAYQTLHLEGYAHSVEIWHEENLVGGLFGVSIGRIFFGESMFHCVKDTSKIALVTLVHQLKKGDFLIDSRLNENPIFLADGPR